MSASEKLRAAEVESSNREDELSYIGPGPWYAIALALPQIVAVVEAAELHLDLHDPRSRQNTAPLTTALAALDEALGGVRR